MSIHMRWLRHTAKDGATVATLLVNGAFECYGVEDMVRKDGEKVFGETAIPFGSYSVIINESPKFKRRLPRLLDVPGFGGILIHPGTTKEHTYGCLLVGRRFLLEPTPHLIDSKVAFNALFQKLDAASQRLEAITISIEDGGDLVKD